jgi:hypothetical protein
VTLAEKIMPAADLSEQEWRSRAHKLHQGFFTKRSQIVRRPKSGILVAGWRDIVLLCNSQTLAILHDLQLLRFRMILYVTAVVFNRLYFFITDIS